MGFSVEFIENVWQMCRAFGDLNTRVIAAGEKLVSTNAAKCPATWAERPRAGNRLRQKILKIAVDNFTCPV